MNDETPERNWVEMKREDFEKQPDSKPAPPGQGELFEAPPTRAKGRRVVRVEPCPYGTIDLLSLVEPDE
ncbi:hypothetical protein ACFCYF_42785 [Streptomyces chartreusis]|uniref:hypothetical protein n=1 Tax=Streptomyces chartreusis TaxID=1969 RepID=UPI0035DB87FD